MIYVYDIESYINFFCVTFKEVNTKKIFKFVLFSDKNEAIYNDLDRLYKFINANQNKWLVGYNSKFFDNQIINYIYKNYSLFSILPLWEIINNIYKFMLSVINDERTEYKYKLPFKSVDLMRVGNVEKKSLKLVAVNLDWPLIQDLPYDFDSTIKSEDVNTLLEYNLNDVEITEALYHKLSKDINVRWEVGQKYGLDLMSESDSGMANRLMEKMYSDTSNIPVKDLKDMRTERKIIHYENIVFPQIQFRTEQLKALLEEIKSQTWYKSQPYFNKTIVFDGVKYKLGIGGIHSDDHPGIFEETSDTKIIDCDIASMYPNLVVINELFPAHLSRKFLDLYKQIIEHRIKAKKEGRDTEAYVLKILVNSVFGKTLYEKHWLYDPLVGLRVTINGQLYMLMLIELLVINNFKVISANTDGLVTLVPKERETEYKEICKQWEKYTKFDLEFTEYIKYVRKDVNNYITIKSNKSTKEKGDFLQADKISLRQGIDRPIISKALYNYFVHNVPIEQTIRDSNNIYDFCVAKKVDKKFTNEFHTLVDNLHHIDVLQRSVRYYVSTNGGALYKVDREHKEGKWKNYMCGFGEENPNAGKISPQYINYCVNRKVTILNNNKDFKDIKDRNIDYGYYISETQKVVDQIINPQLTLF